MIDRSRSKMPEDQINECEYWLVNAFKNYFFVSRVVLPLERLILWLNISTKRSRNTIWVWIYSRCRELNVESRVLKLQRTWLFGVQNISEIGRLETEELKQIVSVLAMVDIESENSNFATFD